MKKYLLLLSLCILLGLVGCRSDDFLSDFDLAVIETTSNANESVISYYDSQLNQVGKQQFPYGSMGSPFDIAKVHNRKMYVIPKGLGQTKDLGIVMGLNLKNGETTTYDFNQLSMNSFCVNGEDIYTVNTLNGDSYINAYDVKSKNTTYLKIEQTYVSKLDCYGDTLYAFGCRTNENNVIESFLYVIDLHNFSITKKLDLTAHGNSQYYTLLKENTLYFTNARNHLDEDNQILTAYHLDTEKLEAISLPEANPLQIIDYKDELWISHCNLVQQEGHTLTIYNPKTRQSKVVTFNHLILQIAIKDDRFYASDGTYLYMYQINSDTLKLIKNVKILTQPTYYVSSFFFNN